MLTIKHDVMREEVIEAQGKVEQLRNEEKGKQATLNMLANEKQDAMERMKKI